MSGRRASSVLALACAAVVAASFLMLEPAGVTAQSGASPQLASTPPMGWNSYDAYGTTVTDAQIRANARWMAAHLKSSGWQYVVVDMEWFVTNPTPAGNGKHSHYVIDGHGRYTPALNRFPSAANGAGFKPLADFVHSLGLKFGIHILRGIPKEAVARNLPIAGSVFHAADAADQSDTCPWNPDNYGLDPARPAAQAYYDSIAALYAGWGVDFVKADCIASHPYKADEIRMLSLALQKTGRPIILSLSPGAAPLDKVDELRQYAQMWRISDDVWDLWHSTVPYPQGLGDQFPRAARWAPLSEPGHWPDADMLPLGYLGPAPGWGKPRGTRFSHDEQRTLVTLWCIARSPLMAGGNLPKYDAWTASLLTNPEVLAVDQNSSGNHMVSGDAGKVVWTARAPDGDSYIAIFNTGADVKQVHFSWEELSLSAGNHAIRDLWQRNDLGAAAAIDVSLPPHACKLYRVSTR